MKASKIDSDLRPLIESLKDQKTSLLVIDSKFCPHSKRLLGEIEIASSLAPSSAKSSRVMHVLDLAPRQGPALELLTWLPGVPCLLSSAKVHLGVDAFAKCRELCRNNPEGITIHHVG
jgi:hypothetical protein